MPRGPRICYPGATLHIINRFVERHPFFRAESDYTKFLDIYFEEAESAGLLTFAYILIPNHFHFLVQVPSGEISPFLRRFLSRAAQDMNRRRARTGHLFQGRSKTLIVDSDTYFQTVFEYILMNARRAGLANGIFDWKWSSACEMVSRNDCRIARSALWPYLLGCEFNERNIEEEIKRCRQWLSELDPTGNNKAFVENHHGGFLSSVDFRAQVLKRLERREGRTGSGKRRKSDQRGIPLMWEAIRAAASSAVCGDEWRILWRTRRVAEKHLAWYIAYHEARWTLTRIHHEDSAQKLSISAIAMAISKIRESDEKRRIVERASAALNRSAKVLK